MERIVADNPQEIIWLRLNRLKSLRISESIISQKNLKLQEPLDAALINKKAIGLSSAVESAIGFWNSKTDNLNAKVLSRYYALLQMTIAEQVSSVKNNDDLSQIQRHTEFGHGLGSIRDAEDQFPYNSFVYILRSGHFYSYAKYLGINTKIFDFEKRPKDFKSINENEKTKLLSIADLFRRIPELQPVIKEYTGLWPLSFHVVYASKNLAIQSQQRRLELEGELRGTSNSEKTVIPEEVEKTFLSIIPETDDVTLEYIHSLNLRIRNILQEEDSFSKSKMFTGELNHPSDKYWHEHLNIYKSSYSGSSLIVPIYGVIDDPIVIHFMLLYALSIIVRYLPDLWYEITSGTLDHIGSLIEYYLSIFDNVIPLLMLRRITETEIRVDMSSGLSGRV